MLKRDDRFRVTRRIGVCLVAVVVAAGFTAFLARDIFAGSADLDENGFVNSEDLLLFQREWHQEVPPPEIQERLDSSIEGVVIETDNRPLVTLTLTDENGDPFDPALLRRFRFMAAYITDEGLPSDGRTKYVSLLFDEDNLPTYDQGGVVTDLGGGRFTYKFLEELNIVDPSLTHTVGLQIERRLEDGTRVVSNSLFNFRPDGEPVTQLREIVTTEACNSCHNVLSFHGTRRETGLCVLCHNTGVNDPDTGNSIDLAVMIHKIHQGAALPSVQSGTPYMIGNADFSDVVFPQDTRNCTKCHAGPQGDHYKMFPARHTCGSCHDDIDFEAGVGHFAQTNDNICSGCHPDTLGEEFDQSVPGSHVIPEKSAQLAGLNAEILEVLNAVPGSAPSVRFRLFNDANDPIDINTLDRTRINVAGPTIDYTTQIRETALGSVSLATEAVGQYAYQFDWTIPSSAQGSYTFGIEARGNRFEIVEGDEDTEVREAADNPVAYVALDGGTAVPRREVIDWNKCLACHDVIAFHGDQRREYQYCVMCHNPTQTDIPDRTPEELPAVSVDFKYMIHKIHTGAELENGYVVAGSDFGHVRFPGMREDCETCHLPGTYGVPAPQGAVATIIEATGTEDNVQALLSYSPTATACLACHEQAPHLIDEDGFDAASCASCHGLGKNWAFDKVHEE